MTEHDALLAELRSVRLLYQGALAEIKSLKRVLDRNNDVLTTSEKYQNEERERPRSIK